MKTRKDRKMRYKWQDIPAGQRVGIVRLITTVGIMALVVACGNSGKTGVLTPEQVATLRHRAENGDADASFRLGNALMNGEGTPKDVRSGVVWMRKAAEAGLTKAQCEYGLCLELARGIDKKLVDEQANVKMAIEWYLKAAEKGDTRAMERLGWCYLQDPESGTDLDKARMWLEKAAKGESYLSKLGLDVLNWLSKDHFDLQTLDWDYWRTGTVLDYFIAAKFKWDEWKDNRRAKANVENLLHRAERGDVEAQLKLAEAYENGNGVPVDWQKAREWFAIVAAKGDETGKAGLLRMEERIANAVAPTLVGEFTELLSMADGTNSDVMVELAKRYQNGMGTTKDVLKALSCLTRAATLGNADAQYELAHCYRDGIGVEKNEKKYREHLLAGVMYGCAEARTELAERLLENAEICVQHEANFLNAVFLLRQAVEGGDRRAGQILAKLSLCQENPIVCFHKAVESRELNH